MAQCAECQNCRIVNFHNIRQLLCEFDGAHFSAYDDHEEVSCPNFKLRTKPRVLGEATDYDEMEILFKTSPPFAYVTKRSF